MLSKIYRNLFVKIGLLRSFCRKLHLKLMYPNIEIDSKSFIGKRCLISCANDAVLKISESHIANGVIIIADSKATITISKTFVGYNSLIAAKESIIIKSNCLIAEMVVIRDQDHILKNNVNTMDSGFKIEPVIINENVWLGAKSTILRGSEIPSGAVIGANSVVKGKLEKNTIYAGIPAKKLYTY